MRNMVMEKLKIKTKEIRLNFSLENPPEKIQTMRAVLHAYTFMAVTPSFGVIILELAEDVLIPLLKAIDLIWDLKGTQLILEGQVANPDRVSRNEMKYALMNLLYRYIVSKPKLADLSRIWSCFQREIDAFKRPTPPEYLAILLFLRGTILMFKTKHFSMQKQWKTVKLLAAESIANLEIAMDLWGFTPFQGALASQLTAAYHLGGKRERALQAFDKTRQIAAELGNYEEIWRKKGFELAKLRKLLE